VLVLHRHAFNSKHTSSCSCFTITYSATVPLPRMHPHHVSNLIHQFIAPIQLHWWPGTVGFDVCISNSLSLSPCLLNNKHLPIIQFSEAYFKSYHIEYITSNVSVPIRKSKHNCKSLELIHKTNLLSLINSWLAHVYCSITWVNHGLIRFNRFISRINLEVMEFILSLVYV
jgi:hypothetical protein